MQLTDQLLPVVCELSGKFSVFQQDSGPAHRACETVSFLEYLGDTCFHFTRPVASNSPDLNLVDYRVWGEMQQQLCKMKVHGDDDLKQHMLCLAWPATMAIGHPCLYGQS